MNTENNTAPLWRRLNEEGKDVLPVNGDIFSEIHNIDADIVRAASVIIKYLTMNTDTIKMFGEILAYCENCENDSDNIEWANEMCYDLKDSLVNREKTYNKILDSIKAKAALSNIS
jgi:hypothetical protein